MTRAKNSVVIYDENAAARAPLYFYLARRGLARVVARSLMQARAGWAWVALGTLACSLSCAALRCLGFDPRRCEWVAHSSRSRPARLPSPVHAHPRTQEGVDSSDLGITKARSGPAEWAAQGDALLQKVGCRWLSERLDSPQAGSACSYSRRRSGCRFMRQGLPS